MNNIIFLKIFSLAHQSSFLDSLIVFCAETFGYLMIAVAFIYLLFHMDGVFDYRKPFLQWRNKFKEIFLVFFTSVFAWGLAEVLKNFIISPRPFLYFQNLKPLFVHGGMDSFPSGHAMFFSALAMSLYFIHRRIGIIFIFVALIVGFARIASGVHFPIDIFIGYILGSVIALIFNLIFRKK
ncbi:phosphatase PAP2 family protein [Candidatus Nomurabacteria bacterium]|nr:phosphatase PAP2 family protein [Candidatus Nomurabacteria bacterium]